MACDTVVVSDCVASGDTLACADIRLPALGWGEKSGMVTNSERCVSRQRPFVPAPGHAKADWWIITEVAQRMGLPTRFPTSMNTTFLPSTRRSPRWRANLASGWI